MKLLRTGLIAGLYIVSLGVSSSHVLAATASAGDADGTPQMLTDLQFDAATSAAATPTALAAISGPGWGFNSLKGGSIGVEATTSLDSTAAGADALEGSYPVAGAGAQYVVANYSVTSLKTQDIYIEFWAKMPGAKQGCKFIKVFGVRSTSTNYSDTTISTNYTGGDYGSINQVTFGDGTAITNDSQNAINLNGNYPKWIGRSYGTANVLTPQMTGFSSTDWGTGWHHFRVHVKYNSGTTSQNEVPDGEYYLEIDGKVYADATGLYNRNPSNGPIDFIQFFGWAQTDPQPFQLWYDDIRISTGGFMSQSLPDPPSNIAAQ